MTKPSLSSPVTDLPLIGPAYAKRLEKLNIQTIEDLLLHLPSRYQDWTLISPIDKVQAGEKVTVRGQIQEFKNEYTHHGKNIQKASVSDATGQISAIWFNQPFLYRTLKKGLHVSLSGKADFDKSGKLILVSPEYERLKHIPPNPCHTTTKTPHQPTSTANSDPCSLLHDPYFTIHTGRLVPIYPETRGVSSKWLRSRIYLALKIVLPELSDWLPPTLRRHQLLDIQTALFLIHFPFSPDQIPPARHRLAFDELLFLHLETQTRKISRKQTHLAHQLQINSVQILEFLRRLPFQLTSAQNRAAQEILSDLAKDKPMNRLLQGDVGSGKTVVAAIGAYATHLSGCQTAIMAPTEILAQQHYATIKQLLEPFGAQVVLQTGRKKYIKKGQDKPFDVLIGTHALLSEIVNFDSLAFAVIDEQHRFGVEQRAKLVQKSTAPHILTMTATPIPRTVALTAYGDLDLSVLDELPPGRLPAKTWIIPQKKRQAAYDWIRKQLKPGNPPHQSPSQAFIICPFIEPSETLTTVKAATQEFKKLSQHIFPNLKLGLLHGKLTGKQKDEVIKKFRSGQLDILVSTPVVEVGIDIPGATIMLIEAADRFGLAQLHQLRGRIGRRGQQAYCLLFSQSSSRKSFTRLKALEKSHSGAELAETDLQFRGPGQIYGTAQHGFLDLKIASFSDTQLVKQTKNTAQEVFSRPKNYPLLHQKLKKRTISPVSPN